MDNVTPLCRGKYELADGKNKEFNYRTKNEALQLVTYWGPSTKELFYMHKDSLLAGFWIKSSKLMPMDEVVYILDHTQPGEHFTSASL